VTILAVGRAGWSSLCRLVSTGRPVTPDTIGPATSLIVLLGPESDVGHAIAAGRPDLAGKALGRWKQTTATTVIEITDQRAPGDTRHARVMLGLARQTGTTAVLTNSVRYLSSADSPVAQVLDAARNNVPLGTPGLPRHNGRAHLATPAEMAAIARDIAGDGDTAAILLKDTTDLASRCSLDPAADLGIGARHLPEAHGDLRGRCEQGLRSYRGNAEHARERLDHELDIIAGTRLASYFLTVADVAMLIKADGIRCAIRGSGAGSLVNYLLGISAVDPLEHGLLMERFLSHTRETMPDIDLDVESARRIEAYRLILGVYGEERCATVCMMETYRARSAIRDVAAALGLPRGEIDALAKAFPHIRAAHIGAALTELPELSDSKLSIPQLTGLFRLAERLDGLPRHVAMHPCGVLLSDATLLDRTAVTRSAADDLPLSQLDKDDAETAGVIKLDVLGVRMQSAMAYALTQIPEPIDLDAIPRDDEPTFELIRNARTIGCFQIESPGQRELVTRVAPTRIDDLIAEISLFRPGPVNSDMIAPFLATRHGVQDPTYPHEALRPALRETGGVVIFHEQVLKIIDTMTGCGLGEADRVRRRLSADPPADWFREAAAANGYTTETIDRVWEVLAAFGAFGFCKAHAAAFAVPVYQSAWLKRHHPAAFYAGVLTHDPGMYPKRVIIQDARLAGVCVLGPDVNTSAEDWIITALVSPPEIRVSLREVKGITAAEVSRIVAARPYHSLRDFWTRARVSRRTTERLILVGALDSLYTVVAKPPTRRDLVARLAVLAPRAHRATRAAAAEGPGRSSAAAEGPGRSSAVASPHDAPGLDFPDSDTGDGFAELVPAGELRDLDPAERISVELDILGFDVSGHVLGFYRDLLDGLGVVRSVDLHRCKPGSTVLVAGVKVATQTPAIRSGQRIIFASLDDEVGLVDMAFFESVQDRCAARLFGSWLLLVRGRVRRSGPEAGGPAAAAGPGQSNAAVTLNAIDCWDLAGLEATRAEGGMAAVLAAIAEQPVRQRASRRPTASSETAKPLVYPTGFTLSPYAEAGGPGPSVKAMPRANYYPELLRNSREAENFRWMRHLCHA
jgi:error-prone DNA polymerase